MTQKRKPTLKVKWIVSDKAQSNVRTWITFFAALGFLYGFYKRGDEPGPYWTLLIGAMLGLAVIVSAVSNVLGADEDDEDDNNDNGDNHAGQHSKSVAQSDPDEMGGTGIPRVRLFHLPWTLAT